MKSVFNHFSHKAAVMNIFKVLEQNLNPRLEGPGARTIDHYAGVLRITFNNLTFSLVQLVIFSGNEDQMNDLLQL